MTPHRLVVALLVAMVVAVSAGSGFIGTGSVFAAVPTAILLRYVFGDAEGTLFAALACTAVLTFAALTRGDAQAASVALGGYVAAELATVATRVRERQSTAGFSVLLIDTSVNIALAVATVAAAAAIALLEPPTWVAVAALATFAVATACALLWAHLRAPTNDHAG